MLIFFFFWLFVLANNHAGQVPTTNSISSSVQSSFQVNSKAFLCYLDLLDAYIIQDLIRDLSKHLYHSSVLKNFIILLWMCFCGCTAEGRIQNLCQLTPELELPFFTSLSLSLALSLSFCDFSDILALWIILHIFFVQKEDINSEI